MDSRTDGKRVLGVLTDPEAQRDAARAVSEGRVVAHGFGNIYALTSRADADTVRAVNRLKGRPAGQTGSITVPPTGIPAVFDWSALPAGVSEDRLLSLVDLLLTLGPIGLRGPAAPHVPAHLTEADGLLRTTQIIAPGHRCPSNAFLARAAALTGERLLFITSANRSRRATGADDEPAHWQAEALQAEFAAEPSVTFLPHADEAAARRSFPDHTPMSTTVLAFPRSASGHGGCPDLIVERIGSLPIESIGGLAADMGFGLTATPETVTRRLTPRVYAAE
ncbi:hypothetical protein [Streptomyces tanashiensis]|uniref:hypothetical protein n=1 Tax=Streptomyces tanashiensis TaxID=67367 RepID=UPI003433DFAF